VPETTKEQILDALRQIQDPDLHQDIVTLGFVTQHTICDGAVKVTINLTTPACR
jgi:ATP-binding protein involved in chromosome partitioning